MFKFEEMKERLKVAFDEKQAELLAEIIYKSYENLVKVSDFSELKEIVRELAEAQKRTEERLNKLTERVDQLTERLDQLTLRVDQLVEAQRKTEEEIRALTEQVKNLAIGLDRANKQIGGLANTIGYTLENEAIKALPKILKRDYKLNVRGKLKRTFVLDRYGGYIEVNIFGEAFKNRTKYTIVGESKSQLSKNDVDDFIIRKIERLEKVFPKIFPVLVTHMISEPDVEEYAKGKGISIFYSYEF